MQCKSFEKEVQCATQATVEVFWPGKTTVACDSHAQKMKHVASVMGFVLDVRPIAPVEQDS